MDFFQHQDMARRRTGLLLFYFLCAVVLTVVAVNIAVFLIYRFGMVGPAPIDPAAWITHPLAGIVSLATLGLIGFGSLLRYMQLREGGHVIADTVGAQRVSPDTTDLRERTLLNIVEEMAIASGTPVPTVYVMREEPGINAFVAGFEPTQAVLVVTEGALDTFNRDEMQGVIGHEFSHILNGDMRMNVQLYAILAGILMIGRVGEFMLRGNRRGNSGRNKGAGAILVLGLALMVIGYVGLFFGRLIKAAISRQRELLADASSVQFTRNPQAIGEALLKIHNAQQGSLLASQYAEDMSHMCFSLPVRMGLAGLLATHPPLEQRISLIDPALLVRDRARKRSAATAGAAPVSAPGAAALAGAVQATSTTAGSAAVSTAPGGGAAVATAAGTLAASIGQPTPNNLAQAMRLHESIPESIRDMLRTPAGARIVIYGIIIAGTDARHEADALACVARGDSEKTASRLRASLPDIRRLGTRLHLPCHDMAIPALRELSPPQKSAFLGVLRELTQVDRHLSIREYLTQSLMDKYLSPDAGALHPVRHRSYANVGGAINGVMSMLCHASGVDTGARAELHARVMRGFGVGTPALLPAAALGPAVLHDALTDLAGLSPLLKKPLLDACIDCISHDGRLQVAEVELVRAIGEALDCPVPPLPGYG